MTNRRRFLALVAAGAAAALPPPRALAQSWPSRPVRLLVGFAAGGNFDGVARILAPGLGERLGQPLVVENRPGAGGNLATEAVLRAPADGHALLLGGAVNTINAALYDKLPFDFEREAAPVAGVARFPNVMTVPSDFPARTVAEFVSHCRAHPGAVNHGSSGNGTTQHLAGELFKRMTGAEFVHVPYRGASQAITDLLGGRVQVLFESLPASIPHIRAGKLRALAVTSRARSEVLPEVPALHEAVPGFEASGWVAVFAPRGTPDEAIRAMNAATNAELAEAKTRARLVDLGAAPLIGTSAELGALVAEETRKWGRLVRAAGIRAE